MNHPDRQFCQHCGHVLGTATPVTPQPGDRQGDLPWWRRLGRSARARGGAVDPNSLALNARRLTAPGGLSGRVRLFRTGCIVLVVAVLLSFVGPLSRPLQRNARTLLGGKQYDAIASTEAEVESAPTAIGGTFQPISQEGPENVLDRHANTAWATRWLPAVASVPDVPATPAGTPTSEPPTTTTTTTPVPTTALVLGDTCINSTSTDSLLRFTFDEPTDIGRIRILPGRYADDTTRPLFTRPRAIEITTDDGCRQFSLTDDGELQELPFDADGVTQVDLRIVDVYREPDSSPTVEISEVVFEHLR